MSSATALLAFVILAGNSLAHGATLLPNELVTWRGKDGDTWKDGSIIGGLLDIFRSGDLINFNGAVNAGGNIVIAQPAVVTSGLYFSGNNDFIFQNNGIRTTTDPLLTTLFSLLNSSVNGKLNIGATASALGTVTVQAGTGTFDLTGTSKNTFDKGIDFYSNRLRIASMDQLGTTLGSLNFLGSATSTPILAIAKSMDINGALTADNRLAISAGKTGNIALETGVTLNWNNSAAGSKTGGALNVGAGASLTLSALDKGHHHFNNNTSDSHGGAIFNSGNLTLGASALFNGNSSGGLGGAISSGSPTATGNSLLTISGNTLFNANSAADKGGAIYFQAGSLTLLADKGHIAFSGNTANSTANAIHLNGNTTLTLSTSTNGNIFFDDPLSCGDTGNNSLNVTGNGIVQFDGHNVLNTNSSVGGGVYISGGQFRVVENASFSTGGSDDSRKFVLGVGGTLAGGGTITSGNGFILSGIVSPDKDVFTCPTGIGTDTVSEEKTIANTLGTLTLDGNVKLDGATIKLNVGDNNTSDMLAISGSVSHGATSTIDLGEWHNGKYNIATATAGLHVGTDGISALVTLNGQELTGRMGAELWTEGDGGELWLELLLNNSNQFWNNAYGHGNGVWDYSHKHWVDDFLLPVVEGFAAYDYATFTDQYDGDVQVHDGGVLTSGMLIEGGTYSFTGGKITGKIAGTGIAHTKTGKLEVKNSTATFKNELDFAEGLAVGVDGKVVLGEGGSLATGMNVNLDAKGELDFALSSDSLQRNTIEGSGNVAHTGAGQLTLGGTYTNAKGTFTQDYGSGGVALAGKTWGGSFVQKDGAGRFTALNGSKITGDAEFSGVVDHQGTLSVGGNLTLNEASLSIALAENNVSDSITVTGTLTANGTSIIDLENWVAGGTYTLITANNSTPIVSGNFEVMLNNQTIGKRQEAILSVNTSGTNDTLTLTTSQKNVTLTWSGNNNGSWDFTTENNWKDNDGDNETFLSRDTVVFDDAGNNKADIAVSGMGVEVAGMTVTGKGYVFGQGDIKGVKDATSSGALDIEDGGSATFANTLEFENGIAIKSGGELILADGGSFKGAAPIQNAGTLVVDRSEGYLFDAKLEGAGTLEKKGQGGLTIANAADTTGKLWHREGTVVLNSSWGGGLQLEAGATLTTEKSGITIAANDGDIVIKGTIDSHETLTIGKTGSSVLLDGATLTFYLESDGITSSANQIVFHGDLDAGATGKNIINITQWNAGEYEIVQADGAIVLDGFSVALNGEIYRPDSSDRLEISLEHKSSDSTTMVLDITCTNNLDMTWKAGSGIWDSALANWDDAEKDDHVFIGHDYAIFGVDQVADITVNSGGVLTSGMRVDSGEYTFSGGIINGIKGSDHDHTNTGRLDINGGKVVMNSAAEFSHGTVMSGGSIVLGNDRALGVYDALSVAPTPGSEFDVKGQLTVSGGKSEVIVNEDRTIQNRFVVGGASANSSDQLVFNIASGNTLAITSVRSEDVGIAGGGGAIYAGAEGADKLVFTGGGNLTLSNNHNTQTEGAGAITIAPTTGGAAVDFSPLNSVTLSGNSGGRHSALSAGGSSASVAFGHNVAIVDNHASASGATTDSVRASTVMVHASNGDAELAFGNNANLSRNSAGDAGGIGGTGGGAAVQSLTAKARLTIGDDAVIAGNRAAKGGGLWVSGVSGADVVLGKGTSVRGNSADSVASGEGLGGATVLFVNLKLIKNWFYF